ncbi:ATP-binding cassette domain-containing protein [candidate division WOR-3 bacterium]|nr:ATP-binding cassette domain-containing protein [candidate division WOR-3 bacterium]
MVIIKDICKSFNGKRVLNSINLDFRDGEILTIVGKSGVGKSVLLKLVVGLIDSDSGSINVDNILLDKNTVYDIRKKIGFVFQSSALVESLPVEENIGLALRYIYNLDDDTIKRKVIEAIRMVKLDEKVASMYPSNLSGGMLKRAAIARAIILRPKYIFYDEPTTGLDPIVARAIEDLILTLNNKLNTTSIIVTHDINSAVGISDRIAMLSKGEITFSGMVDDFNKTENQYVKEFKDAYFLKQEK